MKRNMQLLAAFQKSFVESGKYINPLYPTQHDRVSYKKRYIMQNINLICLSLIYAASSDTQLLFFTKKIASLTHTVGLAEFRKLPK